MGCRVLPMTGVGAPYVPLRIGSKLHLSILGLLTRATLMTHQCLKVPLGERL